MATDGHRSLRAHDSPRRRNAPTPRSREHEARPGIWHAQPEGMGRSWPVHLERGVGRGIRRDGAAVFVAIRGHRWCIVVLSSITRRVVVTRRVGDDCMRFGGIGRLAGVVTGLLLMTGGAGAQTLTRGPFVQNPQALPTSASFVWWTNVAGDSTVEYGTTPALGSSMTVPQAGSCEVGSAGHLPHSSRSPASSRHAATTIASRPTARSCRAPTYFTTLHAPRPIPPTCFFTVIGDWGQGTTGEPQIADLQNTADTPMIITVGDNAYPNGTQSELDNNALGVLPAPAPARVLLPDARQPRPQQRRQRQLGELGRTIKTFVLPTNCAASRSATTRSSTATRCSSASTATAAATRRRRNWLDNLLATSPRKWKFVFLHHTRVLVRQRRRLDRQRQQRAQHLGTDLRE